jgi:hypothetical protein
MPALEPSGNQPAKRINCVLRENPHEQAWASSLRFIASEFAHICNTK